MKLSKVVLCVLSSISIYSLSMAGSCDADFRKNGPKGNLEYVGSNINNAKSLEQAKWLLDYYDRCSSSGDASTYFKDLIKRNRVKIEANISKYESQTAALESTKQGCPIYDSCKQKITNDLTLGNWYINTEETLKKRSDSSSMVPSDGEGPYRFAQDCACYIDAANLKGQASIAALYHDKFLEAEKAKADKKEARAEKKALVAAEIEKENERIGKLQATKECKVAKSKRSFCKTSAVVRTLELKIKREKQVGEEAGYVNAALLRNTASAKIGFEGEAAKEKASYQKLTGSTIAVSDCHLEDDYPKESKLPKSFLHDEVKFCGATEDGEQEEGAE